MLESGHWSGLSALAARTDMTGTTRSSGDLDPRRKRLLFRCWHRGTREMDFLIGRFADAHLPAMSDAELAAGHDGVYGWDIDGGDWQFWEEGVSDARLVADTYAQLARSAGAGVVLMHDSTARADEPSAIMRRNNRTLEAITRLVPVLQREGFVFSALPAG